MTNDYFSVLFCFHENHTDVYENGLPIGIIKNDVFFPHELTMSDGTKKRVKLRSDRIQSVRTVTNRILQTAI